LARVVEEFPGQRRQLRRLDAQLEPQPFALLRRVTLADIVGAADIAVEQRVAERAAEFLRVR
jgi:glutathione S-transferase